MSGRGSSSAMKRNPSPVGRTPAVAPSPAARRPGPPAAGADPLASQLATSKDVVTKLNAKVQSQAKELLGLASELREAKDYIALCESRILEFSPDHPLPVTEAHLGTSNSASGRRPPRAPGSATKSREKDWEAWVVQLEQQLANANKKLAKMSKEAYGREGVPSEAEQLAAFVEENAALRADFEKAMDNLRGEERIAEEQRAYINVLREMVDRQERGDLTPSPSELLEESVQLKLRIAELEKQLAAQSGQSAGKLPLRGGGRSVTFESQDKDMLEVVQQCYEENERLKREIALLQAGEGPSSDRNRGGDSGARDRRSAAVAADGNEELLSRVESLQKKLRQTEDQNRVLTERSKSAEHDLAARHEEIENLANTQIELLNAVRDAKKESDEKSKELAQAAQTVASYNALVAELDKCRRSEQDITAQLHQVKSDLGQAQFALESAARKSQMEAEQVQRNFNLQLEEGVRRQQRIEEDLHQTRQKLDVVARERSELAGRVDTAERSATAAARRATDAEGAQHEAELALDNARGQAQVAATTLEGQLRAKDAVVHNLEDQIVLLKTELNRVQAMVTQEQTAGAEINRRLQSLRTEFEAAADQHTRQIDASERARREAQAQADTLGSQVAGLQERAQSAAASMASAAALANRAEVLNTENKRQLDELMLLRAENGELKSAKLNLEQKVESITDQIQFLRNQLSVDSNHHSMARNNLQYELDEAQSRVVQQATLHGELQVVNVALRDENRRLADRVEELEAQIDLTVTQSAGQQEAFAAVTRLRRENASLKQRIRELAQDVTISKNEISTLNDQLAEIALAQGTANDNQGLVKVITSLRKEVRDKSVELGQLRQYEMEMRTKSALAEEAVVGGRRKGSLVAERDREIVVNPKDAIDAAEKASVLTTQLAEQKARIYQLETTNTDLENRLRAIATEQSTRATDSNFEKDLAERDLMFVRSQFDNAERQRRSLEGELSTIRVERNSLLRQNERSHAQIKEYERKVEELKQRLRSIPPPASAAVRAAAGGANATNVQQQLEEINSLRQELQTNYESFRRQQSEALEANRVRAGMQVETEKLRRSLDGKSVEIQDLLRRQGELSAQVAERDGRINSLVREKKELQLNVDRLTESVSSEHEHRAALEDQVSRAEQRLRERESTLLAKFQNVQADCNAKLSRRNAEIQALEIQVSDLTQEKVKLIGQMSNNQHEVALLGEELHETQQLYESAIGERRILESQREMLQSELVRADASLLELSRFDENFERAQDLVNQSMDHLHDAQTGLEYTVDTLATQVGEPTGRAAPAPGGDFRSRMEALEASQRQLRRDAGGRTPERTTRLDMSGMSLTPLSPAPGATTTVAPSRAAAPAPAPASSAADENDEWELKGSGKTAYFKHRGTNEIRYLHPTTGVPAATAAAPAPAAVEKGTTPGKKPSISFAPSTKPGAPEAATRPANDKDLRRKLEELKNNFATMQTRLAPK